MATGYRARHLSALPPLAGGAADPAPAAPRRRVVVVRKRPAAVVASVEPAPEPSPAALADGATLADRVWRQARNGLDRDRLLPADDKRRRDLAPCCECGQPTLPAPSGLCVPCELRRLGVRR